MEWNLRKSFAFNMHHNKIIVLTGEEARKTFYSNLQLSVSKGYAILGGVVRVPLRSDRMTE